MKFSFRRPACSAPQPDDFKAELLKVLHQMSVNTQALTDSVTANTAAVNAAVAEIQSLQSGNGDQAAQAAVDAATSTITANNAALAAVAPPPPQ